MTDKAVSNREQILDIKRRLAVGELSYEEARAEAQPIINDMNVTAEAIAKRYGRKPIKFNFTSLMR